MVRATGSGFKKLSGAYCWTFEWTSSVFARSLVLFSFALALLIRSPLQNDSRCLLEVFLYGHASRISFCHSQCSPLADRKLIGIVIEILLCWFMWRLVAWITHISFRTRLLPGLRENREGRKKERRYLVQLLSCCLLGRWRTHEHFSSTLKASPPFPHGVQSQEHHIKTANHSRLISEISHF